ncbi:alpha/beta hydrolase [Roseiarcaceae bacterium H3SJ34-1]|uniref:alpha/beta fold hydrolase n=1 Tax=Terripilifer ovatus TaxID=3032367 RepID=UPI003AB9A5B0|nr:alpha/beta hydrolase [Roseiarcaceae bacterium H3SJ34-1]
MSEETVRETFLKGADTLDMRGSAVEIVRKGDGPPLLFLHGMDGLEAAAGLVDRLAETFTVYAPSHPGFGASDLPPGITTADDLGYFYLDLLDHLHLDAVTLVGLSLGGWIALEMLVKEPRRISRTVLGAPLGLSTGDRRTQRVVDIFMLSAAEVEQKMQTSPLPPRVDPAAQPVEVLERAAHNRAALSLFGWSPYLHNPKLRQRLHRARLPALILWGDADAIVPCDYAQEITAALPDATLQVLPGCGHRIHVDGAEPAARAIIEFAGVSSAAAAA